MPQVLERYQLTAARTEAIVATTDDLGTVIPISSLNPQIPVGLMCGQRTGLLRVIEEIARLVGHAHIIPDAINGATALEPLAPSGTSFLRATRQLDRPQMQSDRLSPPIA